MLFIHLIVEATCVFINTFYSFSGVYLIGCDAMTGRRRGGGGESAWQMYTRIAKEGRKLREAAERRAANRDKTTFGRGSTSEQYGRSSYSMKEGTFDGYPSLSRRLEDGAVESFTAPRP